MPCTKNLWLFIVMFYGVQLVAEQIVVDCTNDSSSLQTALPKKMFIAAVDIKADFKVDRDELLYLIDIAPTSHISCVQLTQALFYIRKKECFSKIEISYDTTQHVLSFILQGFFVLSSVTLHGSMIGKEKYKSSYIMETGEFFDEKKHAYSLEQIKEKFHQAGCCNAIIKDRISYDKLNKTVTVDLFLQKGPQFSVGNCSFDITSSSGKLEPQDLVIIRQQLNKFFIKRFFLLRYTKDLVEKSIAQLKHYLTKHGFGQSVVTYEELIDKRHRQVDLKVHLVVDEKKEFVFWGNHFFSQANFLENILLYGKSSWHFPGAILSDEIESMYKAKGFWDIKVSVKEELGKVFCMIDEGKRAVVDHVEIKDNLYIPFKKIETECFAHLNNKPFDQDTFSQAISLLKQMYQQHGFWDIAIIKEEFVPISSPADNHKFIHCKAVLTIDEGAIKQLKSVHINDYPQLLLQEPFVQYSVIKNPIPFHYNLIATQKNWLTHYFKELGHAKVMVDYSLVDQADGTVLVWNIHLDEQQVYFGKYVVGGNSKIPFKYLKRELKIEQGQLWDKKKIEKSLTNLRNLELFETISVYSHKELDEQGYVPMGVKLIAADRYEVRTRVGGQQVGKDFSLQQGFSYKLGGTLIANNPFKFGDRVVVEGDFTRFYENFSIRYSMPWLFDRPIRSHIKMYDNHYLQPLFIGSDVSIYNAFQQGILFGLQEKYDYCNYGMSIGIEFKGVTKANIDDIGISIDYDPGLFEKKFAFLLWQPSFMLTNVDNVMNPKSGCSGLISLIAMADIVSQQSLFKFLVEYAVYAQWSSSIVLALRTRVGHVFNQSYRQILPIDRFYLGGANTIRGYDRDYCPPLGLLTNPISAPDVGLPPAADNLWRFVPQGGRTMLNYNCEVRFPIYYEFEGAAFLDGGVLIKDSIHDLRKNVLGGAGFGFRYNTPIGPLRFDLAFKLHRQFPEFESPYVWYLTLGQAF